MVIHDRIALGSTAGLLASIPQVILHYIFFKLGFAKFYAFQIASGAFISKNLTNDPLGLLFGAIIWEISSAFLGILIVLVISLTGKDFWWLKGLLTTSVVMYIAVYGFLFNMGASRVVPWDIGTNFTVFLGNIIFGIFAGYTVKKWGDLPLK